MQLNSELDVDTAGLTKEDNELKWENHNEMLEEMAQQWRIGVVCLDLKWPLFSTSLPSTNVKETFNPSNPLMIAALTLPLLISCTVVL